MSEWNIIIIQRLFQFPVCERTKLDFGVSKLRNEAKVFGVIKSRRSGWNKGASDPKVKHNFFKEYFDLKTWHHTKSYK